jgi:hypothetical protein
MKSENNEDYVKELGTRFCTAKIVGQQIFHVES